MSKISAVIFDHSTLFVDDEATVNEIRSLLEWFVALGLKIMVFSTHGMPLKNLLSEYGYPGVDLFLTEDNVGVKKGGLRWIELASRYANVPPHRFLYIGDGIQDWRTAINSGVFFLFSGWSGEADARITAHVAQTPRDVIMCASHFFLSPPRWQYKLDVPEYGLKLRILLEGNTNLVGTRPRNFDLKDVFHQGLQVDVSDMSGRDILMMHALSSAYNEGLVLPNSYFVAYPSHLAGADNAILEGYLGSAAKFSHSWLKKDLLIRAVDALDSSEERRQHRFVGFENQCNTVHVNFEYAKSIRNRNVIVFDDFTTHSMSLEWARNLLVASGACQVVLLSIGKFVSQRRPSYNIYIPNNPAANFPFRRILYSSSESFRVENRLLEVNNNAPSVIRTSLVKWINRQEQS